LESESTPVGETDGREERSNDGASIL